MKTRILILLLLVSATAALAEVPEPRDPVRRRVETITVRDGKVVTINGEPFIAGGKRPFLGVALVGLTEDLREHYGATKSSGALVGSVEDNSPAAKAGIRVGDVVVAIDGKDVESASDLRSALTDRKDGDSVRIDVLRGGKRQTLVATVVEKEITPLQFRIPEVEGLQRSLDATMRNPEWRARIQALPDCGELQGRIRELESRLKDLERKLQK